MDGSVSTLAPIFASAFATHNSHTVFLVGSAAAVGAGISMAFSEGLSDDGTSPGAATHYARACHGRIDSDRGFLHTLPFLIADVQKALYSPISWSGRTVVIAWIRYKYFSTSFWLSFVQVIFGGALVFAAGV